MKNVLGKIFVFALFIMSLVLMTFAIAVYKSNINWQAKAKATQEELKKVQEQANQFKQEKELNEKYVASSEAARDQVIAKFMRAIAEKDTELKELRDKRAEILQSMQEKIAKLESVEQDLTRATQELKDLRATAQSKQEMVDKQVQRSAQLAAQLHEKESFLAIATERKAQLEKQVAQARLLLKQSGLSIDSLPKDRVPTVDGVVVAVVDDAIEVSLGGDDGLQAGHQIEVYRNDEYLGRAIVQSVKPDRATAVILRDYARGIIQRGDKVTTRLKA
jgi:hypothetical protein